MSKPSRTIWRTLDGKVEVEVIPGQRPDFTPLGGPIPERPPESTRRAALPPEPTLAEMATNFAGAMVRWAAAGAPVVDEATYAARSAACDLCEYWAPQGNAGLGKCLAPGCGCTKFKRWLATENCKHPDGSRW